MSFRRALGPFDATMVVIGAIIGPGIFINPYIVAQRLDSGTLVLTAWLPGGGITLAAAFAEEIKNPKRNLLLALIAA